MASNRSQQKAEGESPAQEASEQAREDAAPEVEESGVASPVENAQLEHTRGGVTSRDDLHDQGVPMTQGQPDEPQGPEDALGVGEKRGDYRERLHGDSHTAVALPDGGEPVYAEDGDGNMVVVDYKPVSRLEPQNPRAEEIGDAPGKGGVSTAAAG